MLRPSRGDQLGPVEVPVATDPRLHFGEDDDDRHRPLAIRSRPARRLYERVEGPCCLSDKRTQTDSLLLAYGTLRSGREEKRDLSVLPCRHRPPEDRKDVGIVGLRDVFTQPRWRADLAWRGLFNPDVEVQDVLPNPKFPIQRNGRVVAVIGLNIDDPGTAPYSDLAQVLNQGSRDVLSSMLCADGKIVDVDFAPHPLELVELIGDHTAQDLFACDCYGHDDMLFPEQAFQVRVGRRLAAIPFSVAKRVAE